MEPADADEDDPMGPPREPCECFCLHCQRSFMSDQIWFQRVINAKDGFPGFWMCPTPNCDGAGYGMDIYPTDPNHPDNAGWSDDDDYDEEDEFDEDELIEPETEYDPAEPQYAQSDQEYHDAGEDIEGEEWKFGLVSPDGVMEPRPVSRAQREWEEEQKRYDMPDERPRVLDWSDREYPTPRPSDDDIPF